MYKLIKNYRKNYTDQVARMFFTSRFAKSKINILVVMLVTVFVRFLFISLVCMLFSINLWVDFFLHSIITILIILNSDMIQEIVMTRKAFFYKITRHLINNYSEKNFRIWKRNTTIVISGTIIFILMLVELSSFMMIYYIIQNLFIYFIIDQIETRKIHNFVNEIKDKPKPTKFKKIEVIENNFIT